MNSFVKWVGGKSRSYQELKEFFPDMSKIRKYVEPFVGGGGMFMNIVRDYSFDEVVLNDMEMDLVICYDVLKRYAYGLCEELRKIEDEYNGRDKEGKEKLYYDVRNRFNEGRSKTIYRNPYHVHDNIGRCRDFIFLNKTTFNGLYRVNKDGNFNSPWGHKAGQLKIYNEQNLLSFGGLLRDVRITALPFAEVLKAYDGKFALDKRTFVYLDPPYFDSYCSYHSEGFNKKKYLQLVLIGQQLKKNRGVKMMCSMSYHEEMRKMFCDKNWRSYTIFVKRMLAADKKLRGTQREYIFTTYRRSPKRKQLKLWQ